MKDNTTWMCRNLCRLAIQRFWLQRNELKDVLDVYGIGKDDKCRESVVKLLLKTRRDFINGFSFFTRESVDGQVLNLMRKHHHPCMNG